MKILEQGQLPQPKRPSYDGLKLTCPKCNTHFQLEGGDTPSQSERSPTGASWFKCPLPDCGREIKVSYDVMVRNRQDQSEQARLENERGDKALADQTTAFIHGHKGWG